MAIEELAAEVRSIPDPLLRAAAAQQAFAVAQRALIDLRDIRDLALNELRHEQGMSCRTVEREMRDRGVQISKSSVAEITG